MLIIITIIMKWIYLRMKYVLSYFSFLGSSKLQNISAPHLPQSYKFL